MDLDTSTSSISTDIPAQEFIIIKKPSEKPPEKVPVVPLRKVVWLLLN